MSENTDTTNAELAAAANAAPTPAATPEVTDVGAFTLCIEPPEAGGDDQTIAVLHNDTTLFEARVRNAAEREWFKALATSLCTALGNAIADVNAQATGLADAIDAHRQALAVTLSRLGAGTVEDLARLTCPEQAAALDPLVVGVIDSASTRLAVLAGCQAIAEGHELDLSTVAEPVRNHPALQAVLTLRDKSNDLATCLAAAVPPAQPDTLAPAAPLTRELSKQLLESELVAESMPAVVHAVGALCRYTEAIEGAYLRAVSDNSVKDTLLARAVNEVRTLRGVPTLHPSHVCESFRQARRTFVTNPGPANLVSLAGALS